MIGRRLAAMFVIGLVSFVLIIAFVTTPPVAGPSTEAGRTPLAQPTQLAAVDPLAPLIDPVVVVDGRFDDRAERTVRSPTRHKNQSKLFFADGQWWGVLQEPVSRESRIQRLDWSTQRWHDTGVVVDERPFARADVLFHGDTLYVASAGISDSPGQAVRVAIFSYDRATGRWSLRPDFPITINSTGVVSSLIERADDGLLWVSYIEAGRLQVSHSTENDHRWVDPYRPVAAGTEVASDQVGMVATSGEVILLWSNQNDDAFFAATHLDGRSDADWEPSSVVLQGLLLADDHVNFKALGDGRLFAAVKTSLDDMPSFQPGWDQILLLTRQGSVWSAQQVGQIRDRHTRPIIVLDTEHDEVLIFATTPTLGGSIVMKHAPFGSLQFPAGKGREVIATTPDARINDATSTKQTVDAGTGLVVLASDDSTGRYIHLAASLGGPAPGVPATEDPPDGPEPGPADSIILLDERSDVHVVGDPVHRLWRTAPGQADGTVAYVRREGQDLAVRLRTTGIGQLRPCRSLGRTQTGRVKVSMDIRLDRQGAGDTTLLMARGEGEELGSIRVDDQRRVRISKADDRETTDVRIVAGRWYRVEMDLDIESRTFEARLLDVDGTSLLERTRQPWRDARPSVMDGLCVGTSTGERGLGMSFDNVRVTRIP